MASHAELLKESPRKNEGDSLNSERLRKVTERLLTLEDQMSLCSKVLEDLQEVQRVVEKRNLQDAVLETPK